MRKQRSLAAVVMLLCVAAPVMAQSGGVRAGISGDPDQFFFGGHFETRPLADHITFRPNLEVGIGDDLTLVAINIEFVYSFTTRRSNPWRVYVGAGPAAVIESVHDGGGTDMGGGFNLLVGAQHRKGLFGELKVGFADSPQVKFAVGYAFR